MDCIVYGVKKSRTRLSDFHFHFDQALLRILRIKHLKMIKNCNHRTLNYVRGPPKARASCDCVGHAPVAPALKITAHVNCEGLNKLT